MKMRDYPLEEQQRMGRECNYFGWGSFDEWIKYMSDVEVFEGNEEPHYYTQAEADELIADILANPEDKVCFAKRMAVDPDSVTTEKMIERIKANIR